MAHPLGKLLQVAGLLLFVVMAAGFLLLPQGLELPFLLLGMASLAATIIAGQALLVRRWRAFGQEVGFPPMALPVPGGPTSGRSWAAPSGAAPGMPPGLPPGGPGVGGRGPWRGRGGPFPTFRGTWGDRVVLLRSGAGGNGRGSEDEHWHAVEMLLPRLTPGLAVRIAPAGLGGMLASSGPASTAARHEVRLGHAEFDRRFAIRASDADAARRALHIEAQQALLQLAPFRALRVEPVLVPLGLVPDAAPVPPEVMLQGLPAPLAGLLRTAGATALPEGLVLVPALRLMRGPWDLDAAATRRDLPHLARLAEAFEEAAPAAPPPA